ncbi:MAG: 16S rRNA (guanine(966)-N(2))-methyltransferase RsmD [Actinobacteria bacterium]|nr:16S rRNA (guanine(966)-N(2))-methyltransferase RsmD [Actinomycetota bacterium]
MRVVSGEVGGRRLVAPPGRATRPTSDRAREAVFAALGSLGAVQGARVLDLFAGSGALGIEALSRGADHATFVDDDRTARATVERNLAACGLAARAEVVASDARRFLDQRDGPWGLVLVDPPYAFDDWDGLLRAVAARMAPDGVVVAESDRDVTVPAPLGLARARRYGSTVVTFARLPGDPIPGDAT